MSKYDSLTKRIHVEMPAVLAGVLGPGEIESFVKDWRTKVDSLDGNTLVLKDFFREVLTISQSLSIAYDLDPSIRRHLRQLILEVFTRKDVPTDAVADAKPASTFNPGERAGTNINNTSKHYVFLQVLESVSQQIDQIEKQTDVLKRHLYTSSTNLQISLYTKTTLQNWCSDERSALDFDPFGIDDMKAIVDSIYEFAANKYGPSDADVLLSHAVRSAEGLTQARDFSPRLFL